jgi:malate dehydrogenase (oxaloacetate-decarboxylating)(NADP+)
MDPLQYHALAPAGKIGIQTTKPLNTQEELSLAYSPGVALVSEAIAKNPEDVWKYTGRGNTIAIISDGTAVLGLGNIGPLAAMPVMEGKSGLFKKFAGIDCMPLCLSFKEKPWVEQFIAAVASMEPNFAAINLEDIKAPECFEIQERLDAMMDIPVFHDDQDGTAVILLAALISALEVVDKKFGTIKLVINGAGAAGIAFARLIHSYGVSKEQIFMCDSQGLITADRGDLNKYKEEFAQKAPAQSLAEAMQGADVFVGVSAAGCVSQDMVRGMARDAIVFAAANPVPEIMPDLALAAGAKIVGTGRSDFPNQVNNLLGFPGIFRGALDARAKKITHAMKIAAAEALAKVLREPVEGEARRVLEEAYPNELEKFARTNPIAADYILPKPFDIRVVPAVAKAVREAV